MSVFMGDGLGGLTHDATYTADAQTRGLCVVDLNGDGAADIVTANRNGAGNTGNISIFINDGTGNFTQKYGSR